MEFTRGPYFIILLYYPFFPFYIFVLRAFFTRPSLPHDNAYNCWFLLYFDLSCTLKAYYRNTKCAQIRKRDSPFYRNVTLSPLSLEMHPFAIYRQSNNWSSLLVVSNRVYDLVALADKSTFVRAVTARCTRPTRNQFYIRRNESCACTLHITDQT